MSESNEEAAAEEEVRLGDPEVTNGPFKMSVTLHVLEHLGENLYSSTPAVLSEAVANSWDANATNVDITIDTAAQTIVIADDGDGMTEEEVNKKFLAVGYHRRDPEEGEPSVTRLGRHVMGRKGIGKLSLFAIANTIEVQTVRRTVAGEQDEQISYGTAIGLTMNRSEIKQRAKERSDYYPPPLPSDRVDVQNGTRLTLSGLDAKATKLTVTSLRRRIARRFSIIGADHDFTVNVDGDAIGIEDRDYFKSLQYLWSIGDVGNAYESLAVNADRKGMLSGALDSDKKWTVTGWVGTVSEHSSLEEGNDVVVLLAWGKLVQEDLLNAVKAGGLYTKYVIGELRADFLDVDEAPDIATSDRQRLKETDERYQALREWFRDVVLAEVERNWRKWRREGAFDRALGDPGVKEWYDALAGGDDKAAAKKLFGRIGTVMRDRQTERAELYRHMILAFETLRVRRALGHIDELPDDANVDSFAVVFSGLDELEGAEYHKIAKGRLAVIERFREIAPEQKERVVQAYLFDHLWLLHPSWERPTTNKQIEQAVQTEWGKIDAKLTDEEKKGRIDIRYTTAAGRHVIVELKKASVSVNVFALAEQMHKYRSALKKVLRAHFGIDEPDIEVVAIVGKIPTEPEPKTRDGLLSAINGRMLTYDVLIQEALDSYRDYLEADERLTRLNTILEKIGGEAAETIEGEAAADDREEAAPAAATEDGAPAAAGAPAANDDEEEAPGGDGSPTPAETSEDRS